MSREKDYDGEPMSCQKSELVRSTWKHPGLEDGEGRQGDKEGRNEGRKGGRKQILIQPRSVGANSILRENRLQLFTDALWNLASSLFLLLLNYLSAPQAASFVSTLPIIVILMWPRSLCVQSRY